MKKILFYCQHVLGMGHFVRSMEILHGLAESKTTIHFINGGKMLPEIELPPSVEVIQLPPIQSNSDFTEIRTDGIKRIDEVKEVRKAKLLDEFENFRPDLVIIELFPFGRKQFTYELVPLLARIKRSGIESKVVCSLRDILVKKRDQQRHEGRVCYWINRYFGGIMVHADPEFQRLEETFLRKDELKVEIAYTGYISKTSPQTNSFSCDDISVDHLLGPLIVVSIGGGRVGAEIVTTAYEASILLKTSLQHTLAIFTGPYFPDDQFETLSSIARNHPHLILRRFTHNFLSWLERADLSISMAGYNTCMDILKTGVRALVFPFTGGANTEQTTRARKLQHSGALRIIEELSPHQLMKDIRAALEWQPMSSDLNLNGVKNSAAYLQSLLLKEKDSEIKGLGLSRSTNPGNSVDCDPLQTELRPFLRCCEEEDKEIHIFLRDDDIDVDEETLRQLLDISLSRSVPINLEIIPGKLTETGIRLLKDHKRFFPELFEFHQHGWMHLNHEKQGRKCEFGTSRNFEQQFADIQKGKLLLEEIFGERFYPSFTPPWNRCTEDTFSVLDRLGFEVLSKDAGEREVSGYNFQEISITLNLYQSRKTGGGLQSPDAIVRQLISQIISGNCVGILLHHKVMDDDAFCLLDLLLAELCRSTVVKFYTIQTLKNSMQSGSISK